MRLAIDTGGTFTDLVLFGDGQDPILHKAPTVPSDPTQGVLDVLAVGAASRHQSVEELLIQADTIVHGTTIALNAVVTGRTARTAFLTTAGHPDILTLREGGRLDAFDHAVDYPKPYVPRRLTFEIGERIDAAGRVVVPLDEWQLDDVVQRVVDADVEAVAVCLLWSMLNGDHERRVAKALATRLPNTPVSLSHEVNPILREYRRASATCIDASLRPIMQRYLGGLEQRLCAAGFGGRLLIVTSQGGVRDAADVARSPIHAIGSGPAMAPVAGRRLLEQLGDDTAIVMDTGGTTFDVSVVRDGRIPRRTDTWIGPAYTGHMTGFPAIDVSSVGAGGGSIAWIDDGGLLHVGPQSAGSDPGPVAFGRGGVDPTFTDACLVLGIIDPDHFMDGAMHLDLASADHAVGSRIGEPLGLDAHRAAAAIHRLATEAMITAVEDITVARGLDPRRAILIAGGGAAGLNAVEIGRRLGCRQVILPPGGAALSAVGGLLGDLAAEFVEVVRTDSSQFAGHLVRRAVDALLERCQHFAASVSTGGKVEVELHVEARYHSQAWDIDVAFDAEVREVPETAQGVATDSLLDHLLERFHRTHLDLFGFDDPTSGVDFTTWRARVACELPDDVQGIGAQGPSPVDAYRTTRRSVYWPGHGSRLSTITVGTPPPGTHLDGPAIIETPYTNLACGPGSHIHVDDAGNVIVDLTAMGAP